MIHYKIINPIIRDIKMKIKKKEQKKKIIKIQSTKNINNNIKNNQLNSIFINSPEKLKDSYNIIIENDDYLKYVNNYEKNGGITKCVKENLNFYFKEKQYIYPYPNSNIQFVTYINNSLKHKDYGDLAKLQAILTKYISFNFSFKVISYITKNKNKNIKDSDILKYILYANNSLKILNIFKPNPKQCDSFNFMSEIIIKHILPQIQIIFKKNKTDPNIDINMNEIKFIDIGCDFLNFSYDIYKKLNISKNNFYGLYSTKNKLFKNLNNNIELNNFKKIVNVSKLPFEDNFFDFVFIHSFLQKIFDIESFLKELKRIIKPNGFILMFCVMGLDKNDSLLCDISNTLNNVFIKNKNIEEYIKNPEYMRYFNYIQWDFIMKKFNFKYAKQSILYSKSKESITLNNSLNYSIYKNIKN